MFLNKKNFPPIFCLKCQSQKISAVLFRKMHFSKRFRSKLHPSEIRTDALIVQVKGFLLLGRTKFEQGVFFYLSWRWCCDKFDLSHRSSLLYHHNFFTDTLHQSVFTLNWDFSFLFFKWRIHSTWMIPANEHHRHNILYFSLAFWDTKVLSSVVFNRCSDHFSYKNLDKNCCNVLNNVI